MARAKKGKKRSKRGSSKKTKNSLSAQLSKVNRILREREPALKKLEQRKCALEKAISLGRKTVTKKLRDECASPRNSGSKGGTWNYPAMATTHTRREAVQPADDFYADGY